MLGLELLLVGLIVSGWCWDCRLFFFRCDWSVILLWILWVCWMGGFRRVVCWVLMCISLYLVLVFGIVVLCWDWVWGWVWWGCWLLCRRWMCCCGNVCGSWVWWEMRWWWWWWWWLLLVWLSGWMSFWCFWFVFGWRDWWISVVNGFLLGRLDCCGCFGMIGCRCRILGYRVWLCRRWIGLLVCRRFRVGCFCLVWLFCVLLLRLYLVCW